MPSVIDVCNRALSHTGTDQTITNLQERSKEARLCSRWYSATLEDMLRMMPWNFAQRRTVLAEISDPPEGWEHQYAYPSDAIYISEVYEVGNFNAARRDITNTNDARVFEISSSGDGTRVVLTNVAPAECRYTIMIEDPNQFPRDFLRTLEYMLASNIAMPLVANTELTQWLNQQAQLALSDAMATSLNESKGPPEPDADWIRARFGPVGRFEDFHGF